MPHNHNRNMQRNEARQCSALGCHKNRSRFSSCCAVHHTKLHHYGHPLGRPIRPKEYAAEEQEVAAFFAAHGSHAALAAATDWIDRWTDRACINGIDTPAFRAMQRFRDEGVPALKLLTRAMGIWLFSTRRPQVLPDDKRLDFAISLGCLQLVPREKLAVQPDKKRRYKRHDAASRHELGQEFRRALAPFFVNIRLGLEQEHASRLQRISDLRTPFTDSTNPL